MLIGCASHIHNPADQSLAEKAQDQLNALVKSQRQAFDAMTGNLQSMAGHEAELYKEMAKREAVIVSRQASKKTWGELRAELGNGGLVSELNTAVEAINKDVNKRLRFLKDKASADRADLQTAEKELTAAKASLTNWNKRIALMEKVIELTPSIEIALSEVKDETGKDKAASFLKKVRDAYKDADFTYVDANGTEKTSKLKDELSSLLDSGKVADLAKHDVDADVIIDAVKNIFKPEAPGLVITIAALAKDLAETERNRTLAYIDSVQKRRVVGVRAQQLLQLAKDIAEEAGHLIPKEQFPDDDEVGGKLQALAIGGDAPDPDKLAGAYLALQHYVTIAGPVNAGIEDAKREVAFIAHLESIQVSQINAAQHEALVARGIEGLVTYHRGGIKPEDIAEIAYEVAQLSILGVVAERVN